MRKAVVMVVLLILLVGVLVVACAPEQPSVLTDKIMVTSPREELDSTPLAEALEELEMVDEGDGLSGIKSEK